MKAKQALAILIIMLIGNSLGASYVCYNPELAIRRHLFFTNPQKSITCTIKKSFYNDKIYGQQYIVNGFTDPGSGNGICFTYVKKNSLGFYYCSGGGSGP